ncbi:MAG TPA: TniQ family protein [Rhizobium sp.]
MMTADAHAPAISIRERYDDVVSDRWPVTVMPQPDELLSSWLHRLAFANGVSPRAFARVLGLNPGMWSAALDLRLPADIANLLYAKTGVAHDQLAAMMLSQGLPKQLLLPLRYNRHRDSSTWVQFCCRCLSEDAQPYFRRDAGWRHGFLAQSMAVDCAIDVRPAIAALQSLTRANSCGNILVLRAATTYAAHQSLTSVQ